MKTIEDAIRIYNEYRGVAEVTEDERIMDMFLAASDALEYYELIDSEADKLTCGEFTRRYERAIKELEELVS